MATGLVLCAALGSGCATRSADVVPKPADPAVFAAWDCERLFDESDAVQQQATEVAYAVDSVAANNIVALGLGVTAFWPALLALRPDGPDALQLADLKGRFEALRGAAATRACGQPTEVMSLQRQAALPVVLGDRLVYEERASLSAPASSLVMQVLALRRDQIEFLLSLDGQAMTPSWRQDLAGNPVLDGRPPLIGWRRLLKPGLVLGQAVAGDLAAADEALPSARVRGQVVAAGPQTVAGRLFDVTVIELTGDAPRARNGQGDVSGGNTGIDGVMAVDSRSGLLLRLDLHCSNPDFSLRRRLVRVEAAGP